MRRFLRRIRGIIGTGLIWAAGFVGFFTVAQLVRVGMTLQIFPGLAFRWAIYGFLTGGTFAGILALTERHRKLEDLSLRRVALWGAVGGFLITCVWASIYGMMPPLWTLSEVSLLSAVFSSGSVALARRGDTKLIEGEEESPLGLEEDLEPERIR